MAASVEITQAVIKETEMHVKVRVLPLSVAPPSRNF